jgi:hypothetical protein
MCTPGKKSPERKKVQDKLRNNLPKVASFVEVKWVEFQKRTIRH